MTITATYFAEMASVVRFLLEVYVLIRDLVKPREGIEKTFKVNNISQDGQQNIVAQEIHADKIVGTYIDSVGKLYYDIGKEKRGYLPPPELPEYFIAREKLLKEIWDKLCNINEEKSTPPQLALVGLGGSGKTILAQVLPNLPNFSKFFPDGVFWLSMGSEITQEDQINSILIKILNYIGNDPIEYPSNDEKISILRYYFLNKKLLFIVDDLWSTVPIQLINKGNYILDKPRHMCYNYSMILEKSQNERIGGRGFEPPCSLEQLFDRQPRMPLPPPAH